MGLGQFGCFVHNAEITLDAAKNPPPPRAPRPGSPTARSVRLGRPHLQHNLFFVPYPRNRIGPFREATPAPIAAAS